MELNLREHQILKTKLLLKSHELFVFSIVAKLNTNNWLLKEQSLHELNIKVQKINTKASKKAIKTSIYQNLKHIFTGTSFIVLFNKQSEIKINILQNSDVIVPFMVKINNKIYTINQIEKLKVLNYKSKILKLVKILKIHKRFIFL